MIFNWLLESLNFYDQKIPQLSSNAKERKVPSTRIQRMVSFGTLGVGLGVGTLAEYTRRTLGIKDDSVGETLDGLFLNKANAERIVATLCKVRGKNTVFHQIVIKLKSSSEFFI